MKHLLSMYIIGYERKFFIFPLGARLYNYYKSPESPAIDSTKYNDKIYKWQTYICGLNVGQAKLQPEL